MSETCNVAVIGSSHDWCSYGQKAVRSFRDRDSRAFPAGRHIATVEGLQAYLSVDALPETLDLVTLYVPAPVGVSFDPESAL